MGSMGQRGVTAWFDDDLRFANEQRKRLDKFFYSQRAYEGRFVALERSPGSIYIQRNCHVDCIVASRRGGSVTFEEKIVRWKGRLYKAITIETHSNLERTFQNQIGDGWIYTSTADYLLYAFGQGDESLRINVFNLPELRQWFTGKEESFTIWDTPNHRYTTRCRIVDLNQIPDSIFITGCKDIVI